jgi:guanylate kinase
MWHFEYVISNHDGEDIDNWEAFCYPIGDARKALDAVAALIEGVAPSAAEKWGEELLQ